MAKTKKDVNELDLSAEEIKKVIMDKYDKESITPITQVIPTGIFPLDYILGGGIPAGRIFEICGSPSSGKTTIISRLVGNMCKMFPKKLVMYADLECKVDPKWLETNGLNNTSNFHLFAPEKAETLFDYISDALVQKDTTSLIVIDSIAATILEKELDDPLKDTYGVIAKFYQKLVNTTRGKLANSNTILVCINQMRDKIGTYFGGQTTTGGAALKYAYAQKIRTSKSSTNFDNETHDINNFSFTTKIKCEKNNIYTDGFESEILVTPKTGIDLKANAAKQMISLGFVEKNGSWFTLPDGSRVQGEEKTIMYLSQNPKLILEFYKSYIRNNFDYKGRLQADLLDCLFQEEMVSKEESIEKGGENA